MSHLRRTLLACSSGILLVLVAACSSDLEAVSLESTAATSNVPVPKVTGLTPAQQKVWERGMRVASNPDENGGPSCTTCHAPDLIDLAVFDFKSEDFHRRDRDNLKKEDIEAIVAFVDLQRERHNIKGLLDPETDRPFQPGGEVLPGNTPIERDAAFFDELKRVGVIPEGEVLNLDDAKDFFKDLGDYADNIEEVKIGIPLPPITSDVARGPEFGTIDETIPSHAFKVTNPRFHEIANRYVSDPSRGNLWSLFDAVEDYTTCDANAMKAGGMLKIECHKLGNMLITQHMLREQALGIEGFGKQPIDFIDYVERFKDNFDPKRDAPRLPSFQSGWLAAETMRKPRGMSTKSVNVGGPPSEGLAQLGYSEEITKDITNRVPMRTFQDEFECNWAWLNFQFDDLRNGGYFNQDCALVGYPIHGTFKEAFTRATTTLNYGGKFMPSEVWFSNMNYFKENPEHYARLKTIETNVCFMNLYLSNDYLERGEFVTTNDSIRFARKCAERIQYHEDERADEAVDLMTSLCESLISKNIGDYDSVKACVVGKNGHHMGG